MSMPAIRTALREADRRVTSPSSQSVTSAGQLAHAVEAHQRLAAGLAAGEPAQLALQRGDLRVDRVDHPERDMDPLARVRRQRQAVEELAGPRACAALSRGPPLPRANSGAP